VERSPEGGVCRPQPTTVINSSDRCNRLQKGKEKLCTVYINQISISISQSIEWWKRNGVLIIQSTSISPIDLTGGGKAISGEKELLKRGYVCHSDIYMSMINTSFSSKERNLQDLPNQGNSRCLR
jgi:hypothetical protein